MKSLNLRVEGVDAFFDEALEMGRRLDRDATPSGAVILAFESMAGLLRAVTAKRWALMQRLHQLGPTSIRALAKALLRDYRGVHADVAALVEAGLIVRDARGKISAPWSRITAELDFGAAV